MPALIDLTGQRFGRLLVVDNAPKIIRKSGTVIRWNCKCECGRTTIATTQDLKRGHTLSCGCYQRQKTAEATTKHGMRHERIYHVWLDMKDRCNNPHNKRYRDYGGRGIFVCDEWQKDFSLFFDYVSRLPHYGESGFTIDRIDNNNGYTPENVRWATISEQNLNKRSTKRVVYDGEQITLIQAEKILGIKYATLLFHHNRGDLEEYIEGRKRTTWS